MKIVDIRTTPLSYRCDPPYGSAGGMQARRGALLVEIETDERVIGIGEAGVGGGVAREIIERVLQPMLIGQDRSDVIERARVPGFHDEQAGEHVSGIATPTRVEEELAECKQAVHVRAVSLE